LMMMEAKKETYSNQRLPTDSNGSDDDKKMWAPSTIGCTDISTNDLDDSSLVDDSDSSQKMMGDDGRKTKKRDFPLKLYQMLQDSKSHGHERIISWDPDGKSFKVHQPDEFVAEVMPKYFNQTKFRSFQRMLNLYNFKKIIVGPMRGGYIHPKFHRDKKELCYTMKIRTRSYTKTPHKGTSKDHSTSNHFPMHNSSDRIDFQNSGSLPVDGYENEVWRAQKIHDTLYDPFMASMNSRQQALASSSFYQEQDREMNEPASSSLDFSGELSGHQPLQQNRTRNFDLPDLHANLNLHPWSNVQESYDQHSLSTPFAINNYHDQQRSNTHVQRPNNTDMNFIDYNTIFYQPLDDDLEPRHLPPPN